LLAVGGYGATWVLAPGRTSEAAVRPESVEAAPAQPPAGPAPALSAPPTNAAPVARSLAAPAAGKPARPTLADEPMPPASSGFAPALDSRAIVKPRPRADSTTATLGDSLPGLAPAPIDLSIPAPVVLDSESLARVDRRQGDSTLRKILRAVNGGKEPPARP
jgi:hypothetical protein